MEFKIWKFLNRIHDIKQFFLLSGFFSNLQSHISFLCESMTSSNKIDAEKSLSMVDMQQDLAKVESQKEQEQFFWRCKVIGLNNEVG
jgi:hypothetical protein